MHAAAFEYVGRFATHDAVSVIEIGSRDLNGSVRLHFPAALWMGLDQIAGPSVDWVGNALDYTPLAPVSHVIACEVFEHTSEWQHLIQRAYNWLAPGGRIIITCAGIGRPVHSAIDGGLALHFGEWYCNVSVNRMRDALEFAGFVSIEVINNDQACDTYATAIKREHGPS